MIPLLKTLFNQLLMDYSSITGKPRFLSLTELERSGLSTDQYQSCFKLQQFFLVKEKRLALETEL